MPGGTEPEREYVCADGTVVGSLSECATPTPAPGQTTSPTPVATQAPSPTPIPTLSPSPAPTNQNFSAKIENAEMYPFEGIHSLYNKTVDGTVTGTWIDPDGELLLVGTGYWHSPNRMLYGFDIRDGSALWEKAITRCDANFDVPGLMLVYNCWAANTSAEMTAYNISNGNELWSVTLHNFGGTVYTWSDIGSARGLETGFAIRSFISVNEIVSDTGDQFAVGYHYYEPLMGVYTSVLDTRAVKTGGLVGRNELPLSMAKSPGSFYFANARHIYFDDYGGNELYYVQNWTGWGVSRSVWNLTTTYPEVGENCTIWQTWPTSSGDMIYYRCTLNKTYPGHPSWNVDWTEKICATDIGTGKLTWMWNGTSTIYYNFQSSAAPPFVKDGFVGFVTDNAKLVMLNKTDGREAWVRSVDCQPFPLTGLNPEDLITRCIMKWPAAVGNYVIYPENSKVTAFALGTGEDGWQMSLSSPGGGVAYRDDVFAVYSNQTVYLMQVGG